MAAAPKPHAALTFSDLEANRLGLANILRTGTDRSVPDALLAPS